MPLHFDIDPHGRLVPADDAVREALADRAGRFLLLPSTPDLLAARRVPAAGGAAEGARCLLCGDLASFPMADFLGFLHTARLGGTLTVSSGGADRAVHFRDGEVRGARSDVVGERVGEVAVRLGFLQPAQLAEVVGGARPVGKALVERGYLSAANLWKCFHEQVAAVFHAILTAREGVFALVERTEAEAPGTPLAVNTQQLLMDGIRRIDELGLFRSRIPGPGAWLRRCQPHRPVTLQPLEEALLALVDGSRTVAEVAREAHLPEFDATKVLYHLAEAGYLEAAEAPAPGPPGLGGAGDRAARIAEGMNAIFHEVAVHVAAARAREPFQAAVRGFLADPGGRFAPLWKGLQPAPDGTLDAAALLANLAAVPGPALPRVAPSDAAARLLLDGLRELLFFQLFQAGERLDRDADDTLSAEVKKLLEALQELR